MGEGIGGEKQREERKEGEKENEKKVRNKEERKKDSKASSFDLPVFQRSKFVRPRVKVRLLDEGYTLRGRDSSYLVYFHPKGCLAGFWDCRECCRVLTLYSTFILN